MKPLFVTRQSLERQLKEAKEALKRTDLTNSQKLYWLKKQNYAHQRLKTI